MNKYLAEIDITSNKYNFSKEIHSHVMASYIVEHSLKLRKHLQTYLKKFFSASTIHGFGHIHGDRHFIEKIFWVGIMSCAVFGSVVLSTTTLNRYATNPTVISIERDRLAWNTSFPGVTVCPSKKLSNSLLDRYIAGTTLRNKTALRTFLVSLSEATYTNFHKVTEFDELSPDSYMRVLLDLQFEFKPTLMNSADPNQNFAFRQVITEMGVCYTFNSVLGAYNSPEYWYNEFWHLVRTTDILFVNPLDGEVFANSGNMSTGFTVYVHGPYEVVDSASKGIFSEDGFFLQLYLTALTIFGSPRTRNLMIQQRQCRFHDESNLHHSPVYSYVLCRMECRLNLAKKICGCIPHFYRRLNGDTVCAVQGLHCLSKYSGRYLALEIILNPPTVFCTPNDVQILRECIRKITLIQKTWTSSTERLITLGKECSCLPNCDDVNYVVEDLKSRSWFLGSTLQWGIKEYPKMRLKRDVIFGFTDVLVYIGGMTGLFLGCSVLSFIEMLYFFSLRLFWYIKRMRQIPEKREEDET